MKRHGNERRHAVDFVGSNFIHR